MPAREAAKLFTETDKASRRLQSPGRRCAEKNDIESTAPYKHSPGKSQKQNLDFPGDLNCDSIRGMEGGGSDANHEKREVCKAVPRPPQPRNSRGWGQEGYANRESHHQSQKTPSKPGKDKDATGENHNEEEKGRKMHRIADNNKRGGRRWL